MTDEVRTKITFGAQGLYHWVVILLSYFAYSFILIMTAEGLVSTSPVRAWRLGLGGRFIRKTVSNGFRQQVS